MRASTPRHPPGGARLSYEDVRDGFLKSPPKTAADELRYFTEIGMFVFYRWQSIASDHGEGEPIDEAAWDHRWNECTVGELKAIKSDAKKLVGDEMDRARAIALLKAIGQRIEPLRSIARGCAWTFWRVWEHFIGAIGLLAFGLLLVWIAPHVPKTLRATADEILPEDTRPAESGNAPIQSDAAMRNAAIGASGRRAD